MPIYDLFCEKCGEELKDEFLSFGEEVKCKTCGEIMKNSIFSPTLNFKYDPKVDKFDWDGNRSRYWDAYKKS